MNRKTVPGRHRRIIRVRKQARTALGFGVRLSKRDKRHPLRCHLAPKKSQLDMILWCHLRKNNEKGR